MKKETKTIIFGLIPVVYIMGGIIWVMLGLKGIVEYNTDFLIVFAIFGFMIIAICWMMTIAFIQSGI